MRFARKQKRVQNGLVLLPLPRTGEGWGEGVSAANAVDFDLEHQGQLASRPRVGEAKSLKASSMLKIFELERVSEHAVRPTRVAL